MKKQFLLLLGITILYTSTIFAQDLNLGADFVSRYIWRGLDVASTPSLQPTIEYNNSGLNVGLWGAYTLSNVEAINNVANESAAGVQQIASASEDLNRLTENLSNLVEQFKLDNNNYAVNHNGNLLAQ